MRRTISHQHGQTVTIVTRESLERAQALWWRPVCDAWPAFAPPPRLQVTTADRVLAEEKSVQGTVFLVTPDACGERTSTHALAGTLCERGLSGVFLVDHDEELRAGLEGDGVLALPTSTEPVILAATLNALGERQSSFENLLAENRNFRRYHGGLRNEMDKIHEELQLAAQVQREFLPDKLPVVPGLDFQVIFRPCGYVSGDVYDVQRLDEQHVGFFLADAVGHGVPAAFMTMVIARSIQMKRIVGDRYELISPTEALTKLNRDMISRHGDSPRFATAVCGIINARTREVRLAVGGHPPPLRIRSARTRNQTAPEVVAVEGGGCLLGIFPDAEFTETSFILGADEVLVLYSDGFETAFPGTEADAHGRKRPTPHYLEHFGAMAQRWGERGSLEASRHLALELDGQSGSLHQIDDLTAMMISPCEVTDHDEEPSNAARAGGVSNALDRLFAGELDAGSAAPRENPPGAAPRHERAR